jgi:cytoskeletal protein RodZ
MSDIKRMPQNTEEHEVASEFNKPQVTTHKSKWPVRILMIVLIVAVLAVGLFLVSKYTTWNILKVNKSSQGTSASGWQAVFLTNGQVYFGQVLKNSESTVVLENVYYLQVQQQAQLAQDQTQNTAAQPNLSLVKLGNELHGPTDKMSINKLQVLFIEDLKNESKVVEAIKNYMAENKL